MVASIKVGSPLFLLAYITKPGLQQAKAEAAGEDGSEFAAKVTEETTKMNKNAATDKADAGAALATVSFVSSVAYTDTNWSA